MTEQYEGGYSCRIRLDESGEERTIQTRVLIMPDIVLTKSKKLVVDETGNFTLKCDVLPGDKQKLKIFFLMNWLTENPTRTGTRR